MASSLGTLVIFFPMFAATFYICQAFRLGVRVAHDEIENPSEAHYFENQKLDHFSAKDSRVFTQRYFEDLESFEHPDGPIFLELCGEGTCSGNSTRSFIGNVSRMFGAALVSLEHRYYGMSSPFKNITGSENMKYLSSKQALFDAAVFLQYYQGLINKKHNKQGFNRWIVVGISYAGALSAWFRLKFPHLVVGSWASSAVVQAVLNYTAYDEQVGVTVGPACKQALQEATRLVEVSLATNATAIKALFKSEMLNDVDFLFYLASAAGGSVKNGFSNKVCEPLLAARTNGKELLVAYANFTVDYAGSSELFDADKLKAAVGSNDVEARNEYCWTWQYCTEFGFFPVAAHSDNVWSSRVNFQYFIDLCSKLFGNGTYPDVETTNLYYGGWNISGSKIMFLNGSQDPWRHASKQFASAEEPAFVLNCETCAHGVDISSHCFEDINRCKELEKAHAFIIGNVNNWLSSNIDMSVYKQ